MTGLADSEKDSAANSCNNQHNVLINLLREFIAKRGWKLKIAKKEPTEQSLLVHTINELGVIQNYLELHQHPFTEPEIVKLYIAAITHDCEKETTEWQEKIHLGEKPPHHTNPEYAKTFVNELVNFLTKNGIDINLGPDDLNDIISTQALHMKAATKNPHAVFNEMMRKHQSERWSELVHLIDLFDDIISIDIIDYSLDILKKNEYHILNERMEFTYHKINNVRGILTSLLHKACEKVYTKYGFVPFLYYCNGTLYVRARKNNSDVQIDVNEIKDSLKNVISDFVSNIDYSNKVVIADPRTKLFGGREFFDSALVDKYFSKLQQRYRAKIDKDALKLPIEYHFGLSVQDKTMVTFADFSKEAKKSKSKFNHESLWANGKTKLEMSHKKDTEVVDDLITRIDEFEEINREFVKDFKKVYGTSISKPQQYSFQLFKEIRDEVIADPINTNREKVVANIEKEYNSFFGSGTYSRLKSLTNDPIKNFELFITPYWEKDDPSTGSTLKIKQLDTKKQGEILSKEFGNVLRNALAECSKLPKDNFAEDVADLLISDLAHPNSITSKYIEDYANKELSTLGKSKEKLFNKTKGERLCPICYKIMPSPSPIKAAFLSDERGVAKVFNNHAVGGLAFDGSVNICKLCYSELLLRRVILGKTPTDLIILFPSLNFTKVQASYTLESIRNMQNKLEQFYSYHNPDLNTRAHLNSMRNLPKQILEKSAEEISSDINPENFVNFFTIKISDETRKKDLKKIEDKINEVWDSVKGFNNEFGTEYASCEKIAEAIFENKAGIPEPARNQIIEEAEVNPVKYSFIYETPNFFVISLPMTFTYNEDEAEVNILFKRILFASYLYLLTDCAVMALPGKEVIHIPESRNIVYVQPNATMKQIIKEEWISLFDLEKWMVAISAAVRLAYEGDYSGRSGIYEVLVQPTVGHVLSRISTKKRIYNNHITILDKLKNTGVLKNETVINSKI